MNGAAVALKLVHTEAPEPAPAPSGEPIERAIGEAVAATVCVLARGMLELQDGGLSATVRTAGGSKVAALYQLQQSTLGKIDFASIVRREGRRVLRGYFDSNFYQHHT